MQKEIKKFEEGELTTCPVCGTEFAGGTMLEEILERIMDLTWMVRKLAYPELNDCKEPISGIDDLVE